MCSGCSAVTYAFVVAICVFFAFFLIQIVHRGESSRATRIGAPECISTSARYAFWPSQATPLSQPDIVIIFFVVFVIFFVLCKFRLPNGVRRFGASWGRPGRRLNRSVPSGFAFLHRVSHFALQAQSCRFLGGRCAFGTRIIMVCGA